MEAAARRGRWVLGPLLMLCALALGWDPSLERVAGFLAVQPVYQDIYDHVRNRFVEGQVLLRGHSSDDLRYVLGRGVVLTPGSDDAWRRAINAGRVGNYLDLQMAGDGLNASLFGTRPIIETRANEYVLFNTRRGRGLGEVNAEIVTSAPLHLDLGGELTIDRCIVAPYDARPGEQLQVRVTYTRGAAYRAAPAVALFLLHERSGQMIPWTPLAGGAMLRGWAMPLVQTPDFARGARAQMTYAFELSAALPSGIYRLCWLLLNSPTDPTMRTRVESPGGFLALKRDEEGGQVWKIDPNEMVWINRQESWSPAWLGKSRATAMMVGSSQSWMSAPLAPGNIELTISGHGVSAADATKAESGESNEWPVLKIEHLTGTKEVFRMPFNHGYAMTRSVRVLWNGPTDLLHVTLENPQTEEAKTPFWPVYLDERTARRRAVVVDSIEWRHE